VVDGPDSRPWYDVGDLLAPCDDPQAAAVLLDVRLGRLLGEPEPGPCPPWCSREHTEPTRFRIHHTTVADFQADTVSAVVSLLSGGPRRGRLGDRWPPLPIRINLSGNFEAGHIQLTARQARQLGDLLAEERAAALLARALAAAADALDGHGPLPDPAPNG
jgi:hypothetical protein